MNSRTRKGGVCVCLLTIGLAVLTAGCGDNDSDSVIADGIFARMGDPLPTATPEQLVIFERGREVAQRRFVDADGLGPDYNVQSCSSCHERPTFGGAAAHYRDFLLELHDCTL